MIQKIKQYITIAAMALSIATPAVALVPATVFANNIQDSLCTGVNNAAENSNSDKCSAGSTDGKESLKKIATKIVGIFSIIVGIVAVIMIIYGGFRYITSGGESGSVSNAKNTLIYAIIGLIIVALAQFIVHYVLGTTESAVQ